MNKNRILFISSDNNLIDAVKQQFLNDCEIISAESGKEGLNLLERSDPFAVVVFDYKIADKSEIAFFRKVHKLTPDSVCVMLTGSADIDAAVKAVNEGAVFRFINEPYQREVLFEALQQSLERYRQIMRMSSYTYTAYVESGKPVRTDRSEGCLAVTGYHGRDFTSDPLLWVSMVVPEFRPLFKNTVERVISGEEIKPVEFKIRKGDGSIRWLRDTIIPHRNAQGEVCKYSGLVEDITERKEMEESLRNRGRSKKMLAKVPGLVFQFLLRTDGSIETLFVSESCRELFGVESGHAKADSSILLSKVCSEDRAEFFRSIAKSAEQLKLWDWQGRVMVDDDQRWCHVVARPERLENGDTLWDGLLLDITERKREEEEVWALAKFAGENPNPVMRISSEGVILFANKSSELLLDSWGRKTGQVVPDHIYDMTSGVMTSGTDHDFELQCGDRIFSLILAYIPDADYVNLYGSDITKGRRAEMELIKKNEILKEHDRLKSEFVSTVSHELRTPLCIFKNIVSNAMAGVMGKLSHRLFESLKMADRSIDRLSGIVSDFLDISKIESGAMKLHKEFIPVQTVVSETICSFETLASAKNIELKSNLCKKDILVNVDRDRIIQIMTNLVGNAIKFIPAESHISIDVSEHQKEVLIAVRDDGPGLSKDEIDKIFDRFVQIHQLAGPGEHGTGLGLTIAKELIQMHGGRIWVESSPGNGCCFFFTLPMCEAEDEKADAEYAVMNQKD
jgi:PAS domain S-box-containing protein